MFKINLDFNKQYKSISTIIKLNLSDFWQYLIFAPNCAMNLVSLTALFAKTTLTDLYQKKKNTCWPCLKLHLWNPLTLSITRKKKKEKVTYKIQMWEKSECKYTCNEQASNFIYVFIFTKNEMDKWKMDRWLLTKAEVAGFIVTWSTEGDGQLISWVGSS